MGFLQDLFKPKKTPTNELNVQQWNSIPFMKKVEMQRGYNTDQNLAKQGVVSPIPARGQPTLSLPKFNFQKALANIFTPKVQAATPIAPRPTPSPSPTPKPLPITIKVPSRGGEEYTVPQTQADALFQAFDKYGEATNAATVLHHPMQISGTPSEIARGKNDFGNTGENPDFESYPEPNKNADGTIDSGLMQVNNATFADMMKNPYWKNALNKRGITSYDDMKDPFKNALAGMLILMRGNYDSTTGSMKSGKRNYKQWFAAPKDMRWDE